MTWGVNNLWISYSMHKEYNSIFCDRLVLGERVFRINTTLAETYKSEMKEHFPEVCELIRDQIDKLTPKEYQANVVKSLRVFAWNPILRTETWETYKKRLEFEKLNINKKKEKEVLVKKYNQAMREYPNLIDYLKANDIL